MITTIEDLVVRTEADYERLPDEGNWEVVNGRAVLLPPNDSEHQDFCLELTLQLRGQLKPTGVYVGQFVAVAIPRWPGEDAPIHKRVPDVVVARKSPTHSFREGNSPDLVVEVLATRRNFERTEKADDYAHAGIAEYWIVNPIDRLVEVYRLQGSDYTLTSTSSDVINLIAFPNVTIDFRTLWPVFKNTV